MSKDLEGHKTNTGHERVNEQKEGDNEGKGVWYTPHTDTQEQLTDRQMGPMT